MFRIPKAGFEEKNLKSSPKKEKQINTQNDKKNHPKI